MLKISSMIMNNGTFDSRLSGLRRADETLSFWAGMAITPDASSGPAGEGKKFKAFDGTSPVSKTNPFPWGLVIESTRSSTPAFVNDFNQMGSGHDTLNYAWGGDYSAFHTPGNTADVSDNFEDPTPVTVNAGQQGVSCPFVLNDDWAGNVDAPIFADANGLLTLTPAPDQGVQLGILRAVNGSGAGIILAVELQIQYWWNL